MRVRRRVVSLAYPRCSACAIVLSRSYPHSLLRELNELGLILLIVLANASPAGHMINVNPTVQFKKDSLTLQDDAHDILWSHCSNANLYGEIRAYTTASTTTLT